MSFRNPSSNVPVSTPYSPQGSPGVFLSQPLDTLPMGGLSILSGVGSGSAAIQIFNPAIESSSGYARLHSFRCHLQSGTALLSGTTTNAIYASVLVPDGPSDLAPGQIVHEILQIVCPGTTGTFRWTITYDAIAQPTIL